MWWSYLDRPQPALEHHAAELDGRDRSRFSRDAYTYAHAPLVAGVILAAAGLEESTLHPSDPHVVGVPPDARRRHRPHRSQRGRSRAPRLPHPRPERLGALVAVAVIAAIHEGWDGAVMLIAIDAALLVILLSEHVRIEVD